MVCPVRRERSGSADAHADAHPSRLDRRDEGLHAEDVHDPREFVGEHVQGLLGGNLRQAFHQKVRRTHPHERTEGMLDCLAAHAHRLRVLIETLLHRFEHVLEVAAIRNGIEMVSTKNILRLRCDASCERSEPVFVTSCVTVRCCSVSTATCTL
jgi:hypothetical protein